MENKNTDNNVGDNRTVNPGVKADRFDKSNPSQDKQQSKTSREYSEFPEQEKQDRDPRTVDPILENADKPFQPIQ